MRIIDIQPRSILSSAGNETVEVNLKAGNGKSSTASIPAGISTGRFEIKNLPVNEAILQINNFKNDLLNREFSQESLDKLLVEFDFAGNVALPISVAFWKLQPLQKKNFPKLFLLLFEGGKHGNPNIGMQEFALLEETITEATVDFKRLSEYLKKQGLATTVGAEGAFSPENFDDIKVLDTLKEIFPHKKIAIDAANTFSKSEPDYETLLKNYNIVSLEDPFSEEAWSKWEAFYQKFGKQIMIVGDDLTVTNGKRLTMALNPPVINAIIIKPNQNGTISGALEVVRLAKEKGLKIIISHRGEETDDTWIVDFAVSVGADFVKFGGMDRGERIAKYNRLRELGMN